MTTDEVLDRLESEYDEEGFLSRLRRGQLDPDGMERLLSLLQALPLGPGPIPVSDSASQEVLARLDARWAEQEPTISRRLVELTWFLPVFMSWQRERVEENGGDPVALDDGINKTINLLYRILGFP